MRHENKPHPRELADFGERTFAFSLDYGLFAWGYWLSSEVVFGSFRTLRQSEYWFVMWSALFLLYQAYSSSEGRSSVGKSLLGLRVVDRRGDPLSLGSALLRAAGYPLSAFFNLGFLWSLANPSRQCWHDLAVGSRVVRARHRGGSSLALIRAGAAACLLVFAGLWAWQRALRPRYEQIMTVAHANVGLSEMARLERAYHRIHGEYADNIFALASVSVAPKSFLESATRLYDPEAGIDIRVTRKGYTIAARARDIESTAVEISGS